MWCWSKWMSRGVHKPIGESKEVGQGVTTEADRMTRDWPWYRLIWHWLLGHELTHGDENYPPPVCRDCELGRLRQSKGERKP